MVYQSPAPPRRKSCEACKVSKRRCDVAFPACSRCVQRKIHCVYPGRQPMPYMDLDLEIPTLDEFADPCPSFPVDVPTDIDIDLLTSQEFVPPTEPIRVEPGYTYSQPQNLWSTPSQVVPLQTNFGISNPRARPPKPLSEVVASRLQYSIDILKDAPRSMVAETKTPWCHPQLYKIHMPRVMQGG